MDNKETKPSFWKRLKKWHKISIIATSVVLAICIILFTVVFAIWHNEISTLMSFEQIRTRNDAHLDGSVYVMKVKGDFYLDKFVQQGGVSNDSQLISFITDNITKGIIDVGFDAPEIACAAFTATTKKGDKVFARNYDFSKTNTCVVFTEANEGRHASISTADLQFLGMDVDSDIEGLMNKITCLAAPYVPLDGMNDAGVSCAIFMTYQGKETVATNQNTDKPDFTSTTLLRLILDYADNLEEAIEIAQSYDLHDSANTSYHYMVADSTGRSAILEWIAGTDITDNDGNARKLVVTYNDNDSHIGKAEAESDFQWVTNFIIQPDYYGEGENKPGHDRYEKIYEELSTTQGTVADESAAMDILATIGRRTWKNDDNNGCTVHSVVYNLTEKTVLWVPNENFDDKTAIFEFKFD